MEHMAELNRGKNRMPHSEQVSSGYCISPDQEWSCSQLCDFIFSCWFLVAQDIKVLGKICMYHPALYIIPILLPCLTVTCELIHITPDSAVAQQTSDIPLQIWTLVNLPLFYLSPPVVEVGRYCHL